MRTYRSQKSALTRALNTEDPAKVITECLRFFTEYNDAGLAYPDDWHRWKRAYFDAEHDARRVMAL